MSMESSQLYLVTSFEEPVGAWKALADHFERDTLVNKLMLKKQYFRMEMKEGTSMEEHIKRMKELTDRLATLNAPVSEEDQVVTLLGSLPPSYSNLVTALEARDVVTLSYAQQSLINEEQKLKGSSGKTANEGTGRALAGKHEKGGNGNKTREKMCFQCGEAGHFRRDCPKIRHQRQFSKIKHKAKPATEPPGMMSPADSESEAAFTTPTVCDSKDWIIDSGASSHMTQRRELLIDYNEFETPQKVCMGDGRTVEAFGKGNINLIMKFQISKPKRVVMYNVLYIPKLACNLFSVRAAANRGNTIKFGKTNCHIRDSNGKLVGMGSLADKLYYLKCEAIIQEQASVSVTKGKADLWHQRLGHLNEQQLREMTNHGLVKGMEIPKSAGLSFCEECVESKMSRKPFKSIGEIRSVRKLQCVHSDVCGPMPTDSIGGKKYFVTFIDDCSRYCKVYFLRNKSEVFDKFKQYEAHAINECGQQIGTLRSDNGGEYMSREFESYLNTRGIHHELTAPYSPAQNGVSERANRTLMESARAMMAQAGLPEKYWAEAVSTAAYLKNRTPTRSVAEKKTPYEKWYGRKPNVSHLRVFGCMAYAYIPDAIRDGKLSKKAQKLRFIGYSNQAKGYRLINESTLKVIIRRDVIFNELDFQTDSSKVTFDNEISEELAQQPQPQEVDQQLHQQGSSPQLCQQPSQQSLQPQQCQQPQEEDQQPHHYPRRQRSVPVRYGIDEYIDIAFLGSEDPISIEEALESKLSHHWKEAADSEYKSLMDNETWDLVELPSGRKPIGCKWVFKTKQDCNGKVERYKARLVAKGYSQKHGVDYDETFSPVVRYSSIRALLAFAVKNRMLIHQMDVVTAFLNGTLEEEIYMEQPPGYIKEGKERLVCKLKKSLYGLKQSSRCWNTVFKSHMESINFSQCSAEPCIFVKREGEDLSIIAVYVDDLIVITSTPELMKNIKEDLAARFRMKDLGKLHHCLGMTIDYDEEEGCLWMHQRQYISSLLEKYGLSQAKVSPTPADTNVKLVKEDGSNPVDPIKYQSMVGSLLYAAVATRPDIAQAVGAVSKYNSYPTESHLTAVKRIFRYLKGTIDLSLKFDRSASQTLMGFTDADWAGDRDDRHSTTGNLFMMSGGAVSWLSRKQPVVALSTTEAEYIALSLATQEATWLKRLLSDITTSPSGPVTINEDNQGTIAVAKNPVSHARTKHIDIKYHYVREALQDGTIDLVYCPTENMIADIFTKPLSRNRFEILRTEMGLLFLPGTK